VNIEIVVVVKMSSREGNFDRYRSASPSRQNHVPKDGGVCSVNCRQGWQMMTAQQSNLLGILTV